MATSRQQPQPTNQQIRIDLIGSVHNRDSTSSKDQRYINFYPESTKNPLSKEPRKYLVKRPGMSLSSTVIGGGATGRGCYYYEGNIYSVFGTKVYKNTTEIQTLTTSTGSVGWSEATGATKYLFLCDGTNAYVITTTGTISQVNATYSAWQASYNYALADKVIPTVANGFYYEVTTDAGSSGGSQPTWPTTIGNTVVDGGITWTCAGSYGGFPTPHVPKPVFLDGYIFLIDSGTADIYNSDLENPLGWSAANFITAEMYPDDSTCLTRQNNQVVVLGKASLEFMFDSGSADSPLSRNDTASSEIGIAAVDSIYQDEKQFIFVGQSGLGGRAVWIVQGFTPKKVSYEGIERILNAEGTNITNAKAYGLRTEGHLFYILNLTSRTLVFDQEEQMWHEWSSNSSGSHVAFQYNYATDSLDGKSILQHTTNGKLYKLDPTLYQDDGTSILAEFITSKLDFNNINRKFMYSMNLIGDTTTSSSTIDFRWSDDDYKTWSNWKTVDLVTRPYFMKLGYFRRRAFNFKHTANSPVRLEGLEFDINMGVN
jgi:hypothetical protein